MEKELIELFGKIYPNLLFYAIRLVGEAEAEDVVQDVFAELWAKGCPCGSASELKAILYRSVYNRSLNIIKHRKVKDNSSALLKELSMERLSYYSPDHSETIARVENMELRKKISSAIENLPEKCRKVFVMSYLYDLPNKEIASFLDISLKTVEAHMYKALKNLRLSLSSEIYRLLILATSLSVIDILNK